MSERLTILMNTSCAFCGENFEMEFYHDEVCATMNLQLGQQLKPVSQESIRKPTCSDCKELHAVRFVALEVGDRFTLDDSSLIWIKVPAHCVPIRNALALQDARELNSWVSCEVHDDAIVIARPV